MPIKTSTKRIPSRVNVDNEPKKEPVFGEALAAGAAAAKNPGAAELFGFVSFVRLKDEFIYSLLLSFTIGSGVEYGFRVIKKM